MALSYEQAVVEARKFIDSEPFDYPGYRYAETTDQPIDDGWYFDFRIERVDETVPEETFGGAPGYLVSSDGGIRIVGWLEYQERIRPQP